MQKLINSILFGKYELISLLGCGSFSTVYLSKHQILECYRAIKILPKQGALDSLLQEAQLLKSLNHPGIPIIYDIEQDDNFFYLVEEYVEGETLEEFLLQQSHISYETFWNLSLQLCDIFLYLHAKTPSPVLYLDLKPEHIIVCGMQLKLIDFNVATFLSNTGNIFNLYGNKDYSAPELFSGNSPNLLSDIYSIGKIMEYISNYLDAPLTPNIHQILKKATNADPALRFETVDELISAIKNEQKCMRQPLSRQKIAIVGSHHGCGTTHIATALVSTLNYLGLDSIYYECGQKNNLRPTLEFVPFLRERNAMLVYKYFKGFPNYGPGIVLPCQNELVSVFDYGNSFPTDLKEFDIILFVCSNSLWHWHEAALIEGSFHNEKNRLKIICNMGQKRTMLWLSKLFSLSVYRYPYDADLFSINQAKIQFVENTLNIKRRKTPFFHLKRLLSPKKF